MSTHSILCSRLVLAFSLSKVIILVKPNSFLFCISNHGDEDVWRKKAQTHGPGFTKYGITNDSGMSSNNTGFPCLSLSHFPITVSWCAVFIQTSYTSSSFLTCSELASSFTEAVRRKLADVPRTHLTTYLHLCPFYGQQCSIHFLN